MLKFKQNPIVINKENIKKLPDTPGVYVFLEKETPLYVGKANSLKSRVLSYLLINLSPKTAQMIKMAGYLGYYEVNSEFEALLLESELIKKIKPKYNSALKDDKHPLYIRITNEKYPRVITARRSDLDTKNIAQFGPFPDSGSVYRVLKTLRRIFPYADHKLGKRGCIYSQIGLCTPCPNDIERESDITIKKSLTQQYKKNIRLIRLVLERKIPTVTKILEKQMQAYSKNEEYERAKTIKKQLDSLNYITQPRTNFHDFLKNPNLAEDLRKDELKKLNKILKKYLVINKAIRRIECFDVAHLSGTYPTASMVTFIDSVPEKNYYRHFKIYLDKKESKRKGRSDTDSMTQVIRRRIKHFDDWGIPDLVVVDGGLTQTSVMHKELLPLGINVVGFSKRPDTLVIAKTSTGSIKLTNLRIKDKEALNLLIRLRNEAHRFARKYHFNLVKRSLFGVEAK